MHVSASSQTLMCQEPLIFLNFHRPLTRGPFLPKLTVTRYGRNLNLKKIQLENSTGKVKLELYIS